MTNLLHWKLDVGSDGIAQLIFDKAHASTNTLNAAVLHELQSSIEIVRENKDIHTLIIRSGKANGFIAGADIDQFAQFKTEDDAFNFIRHGQLVLDQLAALSIPTIAIIDGFCLGGGFELALACRYRIASLDNERTKIGLPEVTLGIQPGWAGSVRLPKLIGAIKALPLLMAGTLVDGKTAARFGIVDVAVPQRELMRAALSFAKEPPRPKIPSLFEQLSNAKYMRSLLGWYMRKQLAKKVRIEHYPAPYTILNGWIKNGISERACEEEARSLATMQASPTAHNLLRVYHLRERLKHLSTGTAFSAKHVHVVGAGTMGGDIAAWCALKSCSVTLQDRAPNYIAPAIARAWTLFLKILKDPRKARTAMDRLLPDVMGTGAAEADVVIEAIFESLPEKQKLFHTVAEMVSGTALLATNTSSIPLDEINQALPNPDRLVGIHFFNPVSKMQLVEVVQGERTNPEVLKSAMAFVRQIDRLPLPVKSRPGFLVNRILVPYLLEAVCLMEEGVSPEMMDQAIVNFGMPMGPITLVDRVGLDVCLSVAENLSKHFSYVTVPEILRTKVKEGHLGVKSGQGFYVYQKDRKIEQKNIEQKSYPDLVDRLILRMLNEAVACLREGVVADADLLDAGMIFATGFAPFRGGPMQYARERGINEIVTRLHTLQEKYGERFVADEGWLQAGLLQKSTKP